MPTTVINDATIYYERTGQGPAVLLIHGMCGDAEVWADQANRLSDRYTCVRYDRRGHTRSTRGDAKRSATHSTPTTPPRSSRSSISRPACSSPPAAAPPSRSTSPSAHGQLLRGAVFSEPPLFCLDRDAGQALMADLAPQLEEAHGRRRPAAAVDAFFSLVCPGLWSRHRRGAQGPLPRQRRHRLHRPALTVTRRRHAADLTAVTIPALVLAGDQSHPSLRSIARRLAAALADARFVELADCGHVTYAERPDDFANAVSVFAAELDRQAATHGGAR